MTTQSEVKVTTAEEGLEVLRGVWSGQGQNVAAIEEACDGGTGKICRNAVHMGFDGYAEEGGDVQDAWRTQLAREGKAKGGSLADLIFGDKGAPAEPSADTK